MSHVAFRRRELAWGRVGCDEWTSRFSDPPGLRWLMAYGVAANTFLCLYIVFFMKIISIAFGNTE